jgi:ribose 5-phosphate isomerase A
MEDAKKRAALEAVKHVRNGYSLGLGSGTTAACAIREIGKIIRQKNWHITGVPTSYQAFLLAVECGIPVTSLDERPKLDLNIDGADQIDKDLNMIKGMGGALTREKIVASASKLNVIVADESKLVRKLGVNHPVPVEVLPFAATTVCLKIHNVGGKPVLRVGNGKVGPVVTDNGNFIIDVYMKSINNLHELDSKLKSISGVVETGLFVGIADIAYVGTRNSVEKISRK